MKIEKTVSAKVTYPNGYEEVFTLGDKVEIYYKTGNNIRGEIIHIGGTAFTIFNEDRIAVYSWYDNIQDIVHIKEV